MSDKIPLLQKGALVAQDPPAFEQVAELDEVERDALRNEVLHKWRQPRSLYFTVILCSIGAAVQGWDQTVSSLLSSSFPLTTLNRALQTVLLAVTIKLSIAC